MAASSRYLRFDLNVTILCNFMQGAYNKAGSLYAPVNLK